MRLSSVFFLPFETVPRRRPEPFHKLQLGPPCHCSASFSLFSGRVLPYRDQRGHTLVHPRADPGTGAAGSSAQSQVHGAVLDVGQHLHDERLRHYTLLRPRRCLQRRYPDG